MRFDPRSRFTFPFGAPLSGWMRRSLVKSIQYGTVTATSGNATGTATITAVDVANAFVISLHHHIIGPEIGYLEIEASRIALTNATTVTATRGQVTTGSGPHGFVVIEFWPGSIKSIQYGTCAFAVGDTSKAATITSVVVAKTLVLYLGLSTAIAAGGLNEYYARVTLTNATTVTATRYATGDVATAGFVAVEFW